MIEAKYCDIDDAELASLVLAKNAITKLTLTGNPISDRSVPTLVAMKSLESVYVRWTKMTERDADQIRESNPKREVFL